MRRVMAVMLSVVVGLLLSASSNEVHAFIGSVVISGVPVTGPDVPGVSAYDARVIALMKTWSVPGAAIAVTRNGRLVLTRGYGWADRDRQTIVQPGSLFRIASVTKPITSAAILHLVEGGRLSLDTKLLDALTRYSLPSGGDLRWRDVTIRQLLQHIGGWDRDASGDPMFMSAKIAHAIGAPQPANADAIIRYMLTRPLDFTPGTRYVYSNFGYCLLGRVIEQVTGQGYEDYVKANVLAPMGITGMRQGHTLLSGQAAAEVNYYDYAGAPNAVSIFPGGGSVPWPYGGFYLEAMDSHGAWVGSVVDLARFLTAIDGARNSAYLSSASRSTMISRPALMSGSTASSWYGMGWSVNTAGNWWHDGSLPGTYTEIVHASNGYTWAIFTNTRPSDSNSFSRAMDQMMWDALGSGLQGSPTDLFSAY